MRCIYRYLELGGGFKLQIFIYLLVVVMFFFQFLLSYVDRVSGKGIFIFLLQCFVQEEVGIQQLLQLLGQIFQCRSMVLMRELVRLLMNRSTVLGCNGIVLKFVFMFVLKDRQRFLLVTKISFFRYFSYLSDIWIIDFLGCRKIFFRFFSVLFIWVFYILLQRIWRLEVG